MNSSLRTTLIAGAAAVLLAGAARSLLLERPPAPPRYLPSNGVMKQGILKVGEPPPALGVRDTRGRPLDLDRYRGQVLLLHFWASWCPYCRADFPSVARTVREYQDRGLKVVGVSLDTDRSRMDAYLYDHHADWPQYFDGQRWGNVLVQRYGVHDIPFCVVIGTDGRIASLGARGRDLNNDVEYALRFK